MSDAAIEAPLPLAYPEQPNPSPRPTSRDEKVRLAAVNSILSEVIEWLAGERYDRDNLVADLLAVAGEHDGYRAACQLDRRGWSPDENLVDILAGLASAVMGAERDAVKVWAEVNGIKPHLSIGDVVITRRGPGPIGKIDEETASYIVETAEHVARFGAGRGGVLVAYELCRLAADAAEAA